MGLEQKNLPLICYWNPELSPTRSLVEADTIESGLSAGNMGLIYLPPHPNMSNLSCPDVDGRFYLLEDVFKITGLKIIQIQPKAITWENIIDLHHELAQHLKIDGTTYPKAVDLYKKLLVGTWTRVTIQALGALPDPALQVRLQEWKGRNHPSGWNNAIDGVSVTPVLKMANLRYVLGDRSPILENENRIWPIPIRHNGIHVPSTVCEAIQFNTLWERI